MGKQSLNFKVSDIKKLDIGSPEHQIYEEFEERISTLEKSLENLKREFIDQFG